MDGLLATMSEDVGLIVGAISFQDFQPMWSQITNVTDRRTDGRHAIPRPRICTKVHCAVKISIVRVSLLFRIHAFIFLAAGTYYLILEATCMISDCKFWQADHKTQNTRFRSTLAPGFGCKSQNFSRRNPHPKIQSTGGCSTLNPGFVANLLHCKVW